jgi:hypothetical protein
MMTGMMRLLRRFVRRGWVWLLVIVQGHGTLAAQTVQTASTAAAGAPSLILLTDALGHGMGLRHALFLDRLFLIWAVLCVASLGAVIGDVAHARRASWRLYLVWVLIALPFGPIAAALYFPYGRLLALGTLAKERDPRPVRIVADAVFAAAGSALGAEIAYLLYYYIGGDGSIRSAAGLATLAAGAVLMSWLVFHGALERATPSPRPMQAVLRALPAALASNLPSLAVVLTVLALAQANWPGLFHPASVAFHAALWAAALAAALLHLPLSAWRTLRNHPTWPPW